MKDGCTAPRSTDCDGLHSALLARQSDWAPGWLLSVLSVHVPLMTVVAATAPLTTDGAAAGMEVALPMTTTTTAGGTVAAAARERGWGSEQRAAAQWQQRQQRVSDARSEA